MQQPWFLAFQPVRLPGLGGRILQFPVTRIVLAAVAIVGLSFAVPQILGAAGLARDSPAGLALELGLAAAVLVGYLGFVRGIERRPVHELRGEGAAGELARGFVIGLGLFGATLLVLCAVGVATVGPGAGAATIVPTLVFSLAAGVTEEVLLRGVVFRIVEESLGSWIALGFSAALFGLGHAGNPGATLVSTLAIMLEAGVLLGAAYMCSRRLWLPIALHAGWNFTEAIFGTAVSGFARRGVWSSQFSGPTLLTGGAFGAEASVVAVALCLSAAAVLLVAARRRGRIVAPRWSRSERVRLA